jgi:hypothetical protein
MAPRRRVARVLTGAAAVLAPTLYVAALFPLDLVLLNTTAAGGDLGSHNYAAAYARTLLATSHRLTGWVPGNFCGFPLFQMYFPLPFAVIALASALLEPNVAFKVTCIAGLIGLPATAYWLLARLRTPFPGPGIGASATLLFLFQSGNSMWGGNVGSTLAGEFVYSLSLLPALLVLGRCAPGRPRRVSVTACAAAALMMTHAYTALWTAAAVGLDAVARRRPARPTLRGAAVFLWGGVLGAFWLLPLVWYGPWTTGFKHTWIIASWTEVFPAQLWPVLAAVVLFPVAIRIKGRAAWRRYIVSSRTLYAATAAAIVAYILAPNFSIVDVRFLPFLQLGLCLLAAAGAGHLVRTWPAPAFALPIVFLATVIAVQAETPRLASWIRWNYEGFERKAAWPVYREIVERLRGDAADPRVVYEHSPDNEALGTIRAFENLPLFSGRSTLEGVNLQASVTSPFVFYIQSEISAVMSCPFPEWGCSRPSLASGVEHLRMMNVSDVIVRSDLVKGEAARLPQLHREAAIGDYEIFRIRGGGDGYAVALERLPYAVASPEWKTEAYRWFKRATPGDAVPVFVRQEADAAEGRFAATLRAQPDKAPAVSLGPAPRLREVFEPERLALSGLEPGRPVLVRISYHPRWRSTTGERVWLAGPGFMLVYPRGDSLELVYGESAVTLAGVAFSLVGLGALLGALLFAGWRGSAEALCSVMGLSSVVASVRERLWHPIARARRLPSLTAAALTVGLVALAYGGVRARRADADAVYREGQRRLDAGDLDGARSAFLEARNLAPLSNTAIHSTYFNAIVLYRQEHFQEAESAFRELLDRYPEAFAAAESSYHVALCAERLGRLDDARAGFEDTARRFPGTQWADFADDRLRSLNPSPSARDANDTASPQRPAR